MSSLRLVTFITLGSFLTGCATITPVRTLDQGEHQIGISTGASMYIEDGESPLTLPIGGLVLSAESGITPVADRPTSILYGVDLLSLPSIPTGIIGVSHMLREENQSPAITLINRNILGYAVDDLLGVQGIGTVHSENMVLYSKTLESEDVPQYIYWGAGAIVGGNFDTVPRDLEMNNNGVATGATAVFGLQLDPKKRIGWQLESKVNYLDTVYGSTNYAKTFTAGLNVTGFIKRPAQ